MKQNDQIFKSVSKRNNHIEAFVLKGENAIRKEIKNFVYQNNLRQQQIAFMTKLNQSTVSYYLTGNHISENSKKAIYKWYLRYLKSQDIYQQAAANNQHNSTDSNSSSQSEAGIFG